ncbi:hypothetical protein QVD17_20776 [Tagetes erecta]|uniref:Uncharacterized protein n=1 Tax=Tagetes erecta TaxID=13708 RepID=A0AAD8KMC3_TARER|nr:hypothetical protein QVD17_20776 [Tagetes erecta]
MFLVQKPNLSSHFRSTTNKPPHIPKTYQLFHQNLIFHLKTLDLTKTTSTISLSWLSTALSFLSTLHTEAEAQMIHISKAQISNLKTDVDDYQSLYMDYSLKVLDLCNLISTAVNQLTERRLLMNFALRLLNFTDQFPVHEKLNKAKDALTRSVNDTQGSGSATAKERGLRAKLLIEELTDLIGKLPRGGRDIVRRTFYALGAMTVFVGSVLVGVLFGEMDVVKPQTIPAEFVWSDSFTGVQSQILDLINSKRNAVLEIDDVSSKAIVICDLLQGVVSGSGDDAAVRVCLVAGVKELVTSVKKYSDGVDELTNGANGLFRSVLKTRNGRLDV